MTDALRFRDLRIQAGAQVLVKEVGLDLEEGEVLALVGASGSGKTLTARSLLGLSAPRPGVMSADLLIRAAGVEHRPYQGLDPALSKRRRRAWRKAAEHRFRRIRGSVVGYLPQDARGALDPLLTVSSQVKEAIQLAASQERPETWLKRAGFPEPEAVAPLFPHQLSGGMAQRACIALCLARGSRFLVADEPTTGLDPTVQEEILAEIRQLAEAGVGVLLITHDLRLVPRVAQRVQIIDSGRVVETLAAGRLNEACSPEARALLGATARVAEGIL